MSKTTVTAADLREFFRADPKRLASLSPEAAATVREGARGKVHPQAVKVHNSRRRTRQYVVGASKAVVEANQSQREALRKAGLLREGARGPLSREAREFLAQPKG